MALQGSIQFEIPYPPLSPSGAPTFNSGVTIDAANEKVAWIFNAPKSGDIRKVGFRTGTVATGATVDVRIETVDAATGDPSGTLWAANTNVSHAIANGDDSVWLTTAALTADATVVKGDLLAVVIANPGASFGNIAFGAFDDDSASSGPAMPYQDLFTASWTKQTAGGGWLIAVEYSDGSYAYVPGCWALSSVSTDTYNSGSTPDERGVKFRLPYPVRVTGFWAWLDLDGDCDIVLYDSDGTTALLTKSLDSSQRVGTAGRLLYYNFASTANLSANTYYRLVIKPTTVTNVSSYRLTAPSSAAMDTYHGGQDFHNTTRTDAGAWTDTTTDRPMLGIVADAFDDAVSAGGGGVGPRIMQVGGGGARPVY